MQEVIEVDTFDQFAEQVRASFAQALKWGDGKLFRTDAKLTETYLGSFHTAEQRQYHNCAACKAFLSRYGGLVAINAAGEVVPAMWGFVNTDTVPQDFKQAAHNLHAVVKGAKLKDQFLSSLTDWGTAVTGDWHHFAVRNPSVYKKAHLTAGQKMAEMRQNFVSLRRAMDEFNENTLGQAVALLEGDALYRSDKFLGHAKALLALRQALVSRSSQKARDALLWRAMATQPDGFANVRSHMIGTLLVDLAGGMAFTDVKARFDAKMHPLSYQRPQAAPSAGNIQQAEKLFETMGLAPALERRYATLAEVVRHATWREPAFAQQSKPGGIFGSLKSLDAAAPIDAGQGKTTWVKFLASVLPSAERIQALFPDAAEMLPFGAITTAVNPDAPPLLAWDRDDARNPFAWYYWHGIPVREFVTGSTAVTAVVPVPSLWGSPQMHDGVVLVLAGASDSRAASAGLHLFPEILRSELRGVRSTIAAFSARGTCATPPGELAAGIVMRKHSKLNLRLNVQSRGTVRTYVIDRWE